MRYDTPLELYEDRDAKGLYRKARTRGIPNFTGVSDPYEEPVNPELVIRTADCTPEDAGLQIIGKLEELGKLACPKA
jgi:adenylylsulfate kinase